MVAHCCNGLLFPEQAAKINAPITAAIAICFFMIASKFKREAPMLCRGSGLASGAGFRMGGREYQHAAILAENEVARLAFRLLDDNRGDRLRRLDPRLGLGRAGAQR